jgi:Flp pilus assembly pilin Flp
LQWQSAIACLIWISVFEMRSCAETRNNNLARLIQDNSGQGMVEYVLVISLIALAVIAFLPPVAGAIIKLVNQIASAVKI